MVAKSFLQLYIPFYPREEGIRGNLVLNIPMLKPRNLYAVPALSTRNTNVETLMGDLLLIPLQTGLPCCAGDLRRGLELGKPTSEPKGTYMFYPSVSLGLTQKSIQCHLIQ